MEKLKRAMAVASKVHSAQMYDQYPYFKHLQDVEQVLIEFGYAENETLRVCAFLHDSMEDAAVSYSDLKKEFGEEVAEIVFCMTDELGRNRKEKKLKTYPKIRSNSDSIIVKLSDRIANVRHSLSNTKDVQSSDGFSAMYQKEYKDFRWNLYVINHAENLWGALDKLMGFNQ